MIRRSTRRANLVCALILWPFALHLEFKMRFPLMVLFTLELQSIVLNVMLPLLLFLFVSEFCNLLSQKKRKADHQLPLPNCITALSLLLFFLPKTPFYLNVGPLTQQVLNEISILPAFSPSLLLVLIFSYHFHLRLLSLLHHLRL